MDHGLPGRRPAPPPSHVQSVEDQLGAQVIGDRPSDDAAGEDVQDDRAVDPALSGAVLGDVGDPEPVRAVGGEPPVDQVRRRLCRGIPDGAAAPATSMDALQTGRAHQPLDAFAAAADTTLEAQLSVDARCAIGAA